MRKLDALFNKFILMDPLCIQSPTFAWRPCQCYLEACLWYSDFQQEHLKPNAKCFLLNYPNTVVWVMSWKFSPLPKEFSTLYPVMDIMLCLSLGRIYPWNMCLNTFSFPLFCLIWWSYFPSIVGLTFLVIYMIWEVIFSAYVNTLLYNSVSKTLLLLLMTFR